MKPLPRSLLSGRASKRRLIWRAALLVLTPLFLVGCNAIRWQVIAMARDGDERTLILSLAPVDIPAGADHLGGAQPAPRSVLVPESGWVHGFSLRLTDAGGDTVPMSVVHHVQLLVPGARELFMPLALRMVAAGPETRDAKLPLSIGVPVEKGDTLLLTAMVHNPTQRDLSSVRIELSLLYTSTDVGPAPVDVYPFFVNITAPGEENAIDLAPGRSAMSWEAKPAVDGEILGFGGHLHRYGVSLQFADVTTGEVLWQARPRIGPDGEIIEIPRKIFYSTRGAKVVAEHTYRITAVYDNPTGKVIPQGAMGTVAGVFRPANARPRANPADSLYLWDLSQKLVSGSHSAMSHAH